MNTSPFLASPGMVILFKWTWLLALGWLAHWAFHHRHARWRLILWRSILCFGLALPVLNFIQFPLIRIPIASAGVGTSQSNTPVSPIVPADAIEPVLSKRQPQTPVAAISPPQDAVSVQSLAAPKPFRWESFLLVVWASGCVFGACRLFRLHLQLSRLRKETCRPSPDLQGLARQIQLRLNVRQKVDVHISDAITSPFVCGLLKPAIILPRLLAQQLSPSEVSALLSHEIAHLRRHDLVWCVAWRWMNAVCWFHPLVWKIAEAHNLACEEEADLVASGLCGEQDSYAQFLARLALRVLALPVVESELTLNASSQIARRLCYLGQKGIEAWNWRHSVAGFGMVGVLFLATAGCEFSKAGPVGPKGGAAKFYEITGTVNITPHPWRTLQNTHGAPEPTWHFGFKCISGTSLWRIENTASVNGIERMFCDGTNMYEYLRQTGPAPDMFNGNPPLGTPRFEPYSPTNDSVSINIFPGTTPSQDVGIGIPWLAFCSGPYLRLPNHVIPLPLRTGMHDTLAYADRTQCFNDDLGLPKTVDLLTSAERYRKSLMDRPPWDHWRLRAQTNFHATIPDGEVKFHYEVTSTTNIGSHEFPVEFKFAGFGSDASNHWYLQVTGVGKVLSIRESGKPQNVFEPGRLQSINDWRFRGEEEPVDAIQYVSREMMAASPTNDPTLQELFARAKLRARVNAAPVPAEVAEAPVEKPAGIGVALDKEGQNIVVRDIFLHMPAADQKDIHPGDRIIAVAQDNEPAVSVKGEKLPQAINLIRGPKGTTVRLTVVPAGEDDSHARIVSLERRESKELSASVNYGWLLRGMKAPDIRMVGVTGGAQERLSNYLGKIVVLEFWATWCSPCQRIMADLQTYSGKNPEWNGQVVLIAASADDNAETARKHLTANGWEQTHNVWVESAALKAFQIDLIPATYVIDQQGKIMTADPADIPQIVNQALGVKSKPYTTSSQ